MAIVTVREMILIEKSFLGIDKHQAPTTTVYTCAGLTRPNDLHSIAKHWADV
jgi:hypothetical protein